MAGTKKYAVPGHVVSAPPSPPTKLGELREGDTLIYGLTIGGTYGIFLRAPATTTERAIAVLRPDVGLIAPLFFNNTHACTPRLVKALNDPKVVLPTHWATSRPRSPSLRRISAASTATWPAWTCG